MIAQARHPLRRSFRAVHFSRQQWKCRRYLTISPELHSRSIAAHFGYWYYLKLASELLILAVKLGDGLRVRDKMWHDDKGEKR